MRVTVFKVNFPHKKFQSNMKALYQQMIILVGANPIFEKYAKNAFHQG